MSRWDYKKGDVQIINNPDATDKPAGYVGLDRANWENVIAGVEDPALKALMQEALDEGDEDLLDTLLQEVPEA